MALGLTPASARVGETLAQCKQRYGKATSVATPYPFGAEAKELAYYTFSKNGIDITVGFLNDKASDLSFTHSVVATPNGTPVPSLTSVEVDTLLAANAGGMQWTSIPDGKLTFFPDSPSMSVRYGVYRQRDDGAMAAVDGPILHIFTAEWMAYVNDQMKAHMEGVTESQKKNLEGF